MPNAKPIGGSVGAVRLRHDHAGASRYALIERYIDSSRPAEVHGFLYDTGAGYPAAKFDPTGAPISGHLLIIRPDAVDELHQQMTQIEAGLYEPVEVIAADGTRARAYEWIGPTDGLTRIDHRK
jgi:gamma-glutamylcyclotransferase (GGCT)/AIG2-like uncharacterized protein YtfP